MDPAENGAGSNGNGNGHLPATNPPPRRLSGFADPAYWDSIDPDTGLTRREAKRQWAKKANEEGRFGGRQPGAGRPRKESVAEYVTAQAEGKKEAIARELISMATQHNSPSVKLGAIDRLITMETNVKKDMRDDEKELLKLSGKDLDSALKDALEGAGVYDYDLPEGDVEDDD